MGDLDDDDEDRTVVLDNGSHTIKAGFAGEESPDAVIRSDVGRSHDADRGRKNTFVGARAQAERGALAISNPMLHGLIQHWDDMESIWNHMFSNELRVPPEAFGVISTEVPLNPKASREKFLEIMFETFGMPRCYLAAAPVLSLYASGRTTGMVMDSGHAQTHTVPIYEGYPLPHAIIRAPTRAGRDVTLSVQAALAIADGELAREIKETHMDVAQTAWLDPDLPGERNYDLPDGRVLTLGDERVRCPEEALFKRRECGDAEHSGLHEDIYKCIMKCEIDVRRDLYNNTVLAGGNTMFPSMGQRMQHEINCLAPCGMRTNIVTPPERAISAWIGGSILSSLSTFQSMWVSASEYDEHGATVVHRKCF
eukprot:TRINITY_DN16820_c0_g1_i1.p1 TRINITY_DN16820_c0_g1~~TRINITY_DN16820_c0_g1_i1.p1  ORF type:complete len:385 (+),score=74.59 TRINITY_DN16820_c0_g1_i1:55-1155(+)